MRKTVLYILTFICSATASAQFSKLNDELFSMQIHLVDEFMDRFNSRTAMPNMSEKYAKDEKANILLLFNSSIFKSKTDTLWEKAQKFTEKVIADSVRLNYEDTAWYAKALCHGMLQKKPVDFYLYVRVGKTVIGRYTWFIEKAEGEIFSLSSGQKHTPFTLMPDDHETNFMSFSRMTGETADYITDFIYGNKSIDQTDVFVTYVKLNLLKIDYVKDLEFVFNQVPGYTFSLKHVSRESTNAGWLINSFTELQTKDK